MIDTHCHLNLSPLIENIKDVISRSEELGVKQMIIVGTDLISSRLGVDIAGKTPNVFCAVGVHPDTIHPNTTNFPFDIYEKDLDELTKNKKVCAIGECGLDYVELQTLTSGEVSQLKNLQKKLFGLQIQLAKKKRLPLVIHCRNTKKASDPVHHGLNAYQDIFDTLDHFSKDDGTIPKFVLHCMSGNKKYLEQGLHRGGYISFAGNLTYPSAENLRELLRATPLERLLFETDAPFLSPQGKRGTSNEPANIAETYHFAAEVLGLHHDQLKIQIQQNVKQIFGI